MFSRYKETKAYRRAYFFLATFLAALPCYLIARAIIRPESPLGAYGVLILTCMGTTAIFLAASKLIDPLVALKRFFDSGFFGSGGRARFAGMLEELQCLYNAEYGWSEKIYYGRSFYNWTWLIGERGDQHMLTIGGSRSGKGVSCIIPNLLRWDRNAFVIDPKGTNTHVTARARAKLGQKVCILDPFGIINPEIYDYTPDNLSGGKIQLASFNPLSNLDPAAPTIVEDITNITEALIIAEADGKNAHFTTSARSLLSGYIAHIISSPEFNAPSLIDVYRIMTRAGEEQDLIHADMMGNTACGALAQQAANRILEGSGSNEFQSVRATLLEQLKWLSSVAAKKNLGHSDFEFDELKKEPMSIFLVIPPEYIDIHRQYIRLIINCAMTAFPKGGKADRKTLFLIDEAHSLGYMESIARAYGRLASYNLILWTFFQDKGQLDLLYGSEAATFIGSSRAVQLFGINDKDALWASQMIGTRGIDASKSVERSSEVMPLRDPASIVQEIGGKEGPQYILRPGKPALLLERAPYFKLPSLLALSGSDPDHPGSYRSADAIPLKDKLMENPDLDPRNRTTEFFH